MNAHSRLLIHEFLLKDVYPSENVTRSDLMMMAMLGAMVSSEEPQLHLRQALMLALFEFVGTLGVADEKAVRTTRFQSSRSACFPSE